MHGRAAFRSEPGAALVELTFALPMLILLTVGIADFGRVFYMGMVLTNAARAGAQYGGQSVGNSTQTALITAAATAVTTANGYSSGVTVTPISPNTTYLYYVCALDDASSVPSNLTDLTPWSSGATCPPTPPNPPQHMIFMVKVTVQKTFNVIASSILPSSVSSLPITRTVVFRVAS